MHGEEEKSTETSPLDTGAAREGAGGSLPPALRTPRIAGDYQRRRILLGACRALAEHGYAALTVRSILELSGASRVSFYECFADKRECVHAAFEAISEHAAADLASVCALVEDWPDQVAVAVAWATRLAATRPEQARLLCLEGVAGDGALVSRVFALHAFYARRLRHGRIYLEDEWALPAVTEAALIGAVASTMVSTRLAGRPERAAEVGADLVQFVLDPFVGSAEARRVARSETWRVALGCRHDPRDRPGDDGDDLPRLRP